MINQSPNQKSMLLCPPTYFKVERPINPWMEASPQVNIDLACHQWNQLSFHLRELGVEIRLLPPQKGLNDLVFTANAGLVHGNKVVLSNFKYPERRREKFYNRKWFQEAGYEIHQLPNYLRFEGNGDAFIWGDTLVGGYGFRTDKKALEVVAQLLGLKLLALKLVDEKYYHLDTCFTPINKEKGHLLYNPRAFSWLSRLKIRYNRLFKKIMAVNTWESEGFACNSVVIGETVLMPSGNAFISDKLKKIGYNVISVPISEFLKAGGGAKCMILELN